MRGLDSSEARPHVRDDKAPREVQGFVRHVEREIILSDKNDVKQIVAAILAAHAADRAERTQASSYVDKYISVLKALNERQDEIDAALNGQKPTPVHDLL